MIERAKTARVSNRIQWLSLAVILFAGWICLIESPKLTNINISDLVKNIGISLICTGAITIFLKWSTNIVDESRYNLLFIENRTNIENILKEEFSVLSKISTNGIVDVFRTREISFNENRKLGDWDNYIKDKRFSDYHSDELNIMGITLDGLFNFDPIHADSDILEIKNECIRKTKYKRVDYLISEIENGVSVNIILPDINSQYLTLRAHTEGIAAEARWKERIELNINILQVVYELLTKNAKKRLNLRLYNNIMYYFLISRNNIAFITTYLGYLEGNKCPSVVYKKTNDDETILYNRYINDFNEIKNKSKQYKFFHLVDNNEVK